MGTALPPLYCMYLKLKFWCAWFHIAVYFAFISKNPAYWLHFTWFTKFLMALYNLWGLRRVRAIVDRWNSGRLGILSPEQIPLGWNPKCVWQPWSQAAAHRFDWNESSDMWVILQDLRAASLESPLCP